jgi:hypothetical protein
MAAAHEAEDREFWGRIAHLQEDEELAFWDSLHADATLSSVYRARQGQREEYASVPTFR